MKKLRFTLTQDQVVLLFYALKCGLELQGDLGPKVSRESIPEIEALTADLAKQLVGLSVTERTTHLIERLQANYGVFPPSPDKDL